MLPQRSCLINHPEDERVQEFGIGCFFNACGPLANSAVPCSVVELTIQDIHDSQAHSAALRTMRHFPANLEPRNAAAALALTLQKYNLGLRPNAKEAHQ